jgi:hypothetical protein
LGSDSGGCNRPNVRPGRLWRDRSTLTAHVVARPRRTPATGTPTRPDRVGRLIPFIIRYLLGSDPASVPDLHLFL